MDCCSSQVSLFLHEQIQGIHFDNIPTYMHHIRSNTMSVCSTSSEISLDILVKVVSAMVFFTMKLIFFFLVVVIREIILWD